MKNSEIMNNKVNESRYNNINNALWLLSKAFSKKECISLLRQII